jgi:agmatinase
MKTRSTSLHIICMPFEASTSFLQGTVSGPKAIVDELDAMDGFDFHLGRNPFKNVPRKTVNPHSHDLLDPLRQQSLADRAARDVLDDNGFPLSLGGEHTVSLGPMRAARSRGPLGIVSLDAHADLRDEYEGSAFSHACVMRRAVDLNCQLLEVGTRAISQGEWKFAKERGINLVEGKRAAFSKDWWGLVDILPDRIYLSIDMDFFDPSEVPAVGTPEPGGPGFEACAEFLHHLFEVRNVVAADIVELKPVEGERASVRLAARLVGILTGLKFGS